MNKLGTKIVSVERREKIKKSLTSNHQKISSGKSSPSSLSSHFWGEKKIREGESPAENETKSEDMPSSEMTLTTRRARLQRVFPKRPSPVPWWKGEHGGRCWDGGLKRN